MTHKETDKETDIATYRLNRPKGRFSEKKKERKKFGTYCLGLFILVLPFEEFSLGPEGRGECGGQTQIKNFKELFSALAWTFSRKGGGAKSKLFEELF